jgi:hypothetical protein
MKLLALALVIAGASVARADDDAPVAKPMAHITDSDGVCGPLRKDLDAKLECKAIAHAKLAGSATADLYAVKADVTRYAVVVTDGGASAASEPIELLGSDCGMMKCDVLDGQTPKLRALHKGAMVALELVAKYHHETHDSGTPKIAGRWQTYDAIVCGKAASGAYTCVTRHRGARDHSCTAKLADDGALTSHCDDVEMLTLD